jgi:membrane-associated protease RseP (regulator of RpoE activity)
MAYLLGIHLSAAMALVFILWLFVLLWPVPMLGYTYDSLTGQILAVERGSPAGQSGIEVGDRIVELYGQPWEAVQHSVNVLSLLDDHGQSIPLVVERDEGRYELSIGLG